MTLSGDGAKFAAKKPGFSTLTSDAGDLHLGPISMASGVAHAGITISGASPRAVFLDGANTYNGDTQVSSGILRLGGSNRIPSTSNLIMGDTAVFQTPTFNTGGFSQNLGTLSLQNASTIDMGSGNSTLRFANSSAAAWNGFALDYFLIGRQRLITFILAILCGWIRRHDPIAAYHIRRKTVWPTNFSLGAKLRAADFDKAQGDFKTRMVFSMLKIFPVILQRR